MEKAYSVIAEIVRRNDSREEMIKEARALIPPQLLAQMDETIQGLVYEGIRSMVGTALRSSRAVAAGQDSPPVPSAIAPITAGRAAAGLVALAEMRAAEKESLLRKWRLSTGKPLYDARRPDLATELDILAPMYVGIGRNYRFLQRLLRALPDDNTTVGAIVSDEAAEEFLSGAAKEVETAA